MNDVVRVGMWSGPRNISTAMMRAFENRVDTIVVDEPLYAAYLARTGIDHPARDEVIASQPKLGQRSTAVSRSGLAARCRNVAICSAPSSTASARNALTP